MGGRRILVDSDDDDDDDDFPSLRPPPSAGTASRRLQPCLSSTARNVAAKPPAPKGVGDTAGPKSTAVRRRKLGPVENDNMLLRPWSVGNERAKQSKPRQPQVLAEPSPCQAPKPERRLRQRVEVRTRKTRRVSELPADDVGEISTEEATVLEDIALGDGSAGSGETSDTGGNEDGNEDGIEEEEEEDEEEEEEDDDDDASDFHNTSSDAFSDDSFGDFFPLPAKKKPAPKTAPIRRPSKESSTRKTARTPSPVNSQANEHVGPCMDEPSSVFFSAEESLTDTLVKPLSHLDLHIPSKKTGHQEPAKPVRSSKTARASTPPPSPPPRGLVSPTKKLPSIPMTPHRPNTDAFWNQQIVNDWNQEHSPRKLLFGPTGDKKLSASDTTGAAPALSPKKGSSTAAMEREAKKLFQKGKHETAEKFLAELDNTITNGELGRLAASTGGVRIVWTNKLNTTAGRANWRRETLRPRQKQPAAGGAESTDTLSATAAAVAVRILHHASIELAEKVIDDESRLFNVLAHEFCHLANFMISGVTGNPHGKEFKAWAAQCSRHFGARGIQVTTKHTYEIDFRYVWTCEACATQFKRHSKSIDPKRHRCGSCRGELRQTKPVPRGGSSSRTGTGTGAGAGTGGSTAQKGPPPPSAYQMFMKENMAVLRRENPGSPQKTIMKLVAERWTRAKEEKQNQSAAGAKTAPDKTAMRVSTAGTDADAEVARLHSAFVDLTLG